MRRTRVLLLAILCMFAAVKPIQSQSTPFILPIQGEPGPASWLFGQAYGNTTGAYSFGELWYRAGQGLHFGLDFPMPCGTPLVAVADGVVVGVDDMARGAGPHNLLIRHDAVGLVSLYGHLQTASSLMIGQTVRQGDVVGLSGDPDVTCDSRPHLHFEVRSLDYRTAYNPVPYIDANWHTLISVSGYGLPYFQQDMDNPRRWMTIYNQPITRFGGERLNNYAASWPPAHGARSPQTAPLTREAPAIPPDASWSVRQVGFDECCRQFWWDPKDPDLFYTIDGSPGQRAAISAWSADTGRITSLIASAPPLLTSPDGLLAIEYADGRATVRDTSTDEQWRTPFLGGSPSISPNNQRLTWTTTAGTISPGQPRPIATVWVASIDGYNARQIASDTGLSGQWLDSDRLLLVRRLNGEDTALSVYDLADGSMTQLGTFTRMRGLSVAPGGGTLMFMLLWQEEPDKSGVYLLSTSGANVAQKLDWFGAWRWRDANSVYYLPFDPAHPYHGLNLYDLTTDSEHQLLAPEDGVFTIMDGMWEVSTDGRRILFHNAANGNLSILEPIAPN